MRRAYGAALALGAALLAGAAAAMDEPLLVDLSSHVIEIDSSFSGASILLFGAIDAPADVVVAVRGPQRAIVVRRKRRALGVWVNRDSVAFRDVPEYYAIAASRPLEYVATPDVLRHHQMGVERLLLEAIWIRTPDEADEFRAALRRGKGRDQLYPVELGKVEFIDERLFHTTLSFPAGVPIGEYVAETFVVRAGQVVSSKTTSLRVEKSGLSADIIEFAHDAAAAYGLIAIVAALMAGWLGSVVFRRA